MRPVLRTVLVAVFGLVLAAAPAAADPAGPTHFRATVNGIVAASDASDAGVADRLEVEVLGGDAFLAVRVATGSRLEVPGYEGEPYVRVEADGAVEVNVRSPARWLNDARFGEADVDVPASADPEAPPEWEVVAVDGEYAWHDHRIHFMSPALPPSVDPDRDGTQAVLDWVVPLTLDGDDLEVLGELVWVPGPSAPVPIGAVVLALAGAALLATRSSRLVACVTGAVACLAGALGAAGALGLPPGVDAEIALLVLPALTLMTLGAGAWSARQGGSGGDALWLLSGLPLGVWAVLQFGSLTRPIVPGGVAVELVRAVTVLALTVGIATLLGAVRWALVVTRLDPDA